MSHRAMAIHEIYLILESEIVVNSLRLESEVRKVGLSRSVDAMLLLSHQRSDVSLDAR